MYGLIFVGAPLAGALIKIIGHCCWFVKLLFFEQGNRKGLPLRSALIIIIGHCC